MANSLNKITTKSILDATIATADIADDAVTLAKMASGTDGQIITYDASGNPTAVGPGTDGQVLTSTGAGSPPAFETPAAGVGGATGVDFNDSVKARFGTGNDLSIEHNGTLSKIANVTGDLRIAGDTIKLVNEDDDETYLKCLNDGAVSLYHDDTVRLETTSAGATITSSGSNHGLKVVHSNGNVAAQMLNKGSGDEGYISLFDGGTSKITMDGEHGRIFASSIRLHTDNAANELDDYEEGTWDVVVTGAESGATTTYSDTGWYTKVGRVVHCHVKLHNVTFPGIGGLLNLSAPFTAKSDIIARGGPCYWEPTSVWDDYTDFVGMQAVIPQSATQFHLDVFRKDEIPTSQSAGSGNRNGNLDTASGVYLQFSITYFV